MSFTSSLPKLSSEIEPTLRKVSRSGNWSERYFSMFCIYVPDMREFAENDGSDAKCRLSLVEMSRSGSKICAAMRETIIRQNTPTVIFLNNSFIISSVKT